MNETPKIEHGTKLHNLRRRGGGRHKEVKGTIPGKTLSEREICSPTNQIGAQRANRARRDEMIT